jgi:ubiquitin C-terminal hydrolase
MTKSLPLFTILYFLSCEFSCSQYMICVQSSAGYVGLNNMGATCYMNALLQQFYMMPKLRSELLSIDDPSPQPV